MPQQKDARSLSHEVLEYVRFRAVEQCQKGEKVGKIAEIFGIHRGTVSHWLAKYRRNGKESLKSRKTPGPTPRLTETKWQRLIDILAKSAVDYGYETPLWTCRRIQEIVEREFGCKMSISGTWKNLRKIGLTCQRPERRALEHDEEKGREWLKNEWPEIQKHAHRWQAMLYFQDECGVSLTAVLGTTWALKGKTPVVKVTGKRGTVCVSSAISPTGRLVFRIERERVNSDIFIGFLKQIMQQHPGRKVIVISDQARPHISHRTKRFVEKNKRRLALYHLPPYSPHMNPDERFNGYLKEHKLKAHQVKSSQEMRHKILCIGRSVQKQPVLVHSFFHGSYVT